jgi:hypothetical protein
MIENIFQVDFEELLKNAPEAVDLNRVCRRIVAEENNKIFDKETYERNKDYSIIANQVVGAEVY